MAVGAPYMVAVAALGMVMALLSRRIILCVMAVVVLALSAGVQLRWYYGGTETAAGEHVEVRVLSSNLRYGRADADEFVALAGSAADVVTVTELTPEAVRKFHLAGISDIFPYSILFPAPQASGNGIWSRYPLSPVSPTRYWNSAMVAARMQVNGLSSEVVVASVHVTSPLRSFDSWRNAIVATRSRLVGLADATESGTVIVAGDFNSTPDMRQFRDLLGHGYRDSVQQLGAGFAPTFPSNSSVPPMITIDHVLTRRAEAGVLQAVTLSGTDHRALLATVRIPTNKATA
ncbi:endonuclease/exonuclease/phosphatase family protein [Mycolicibacterium vaccae]|uniref:Endonuclease/exonuclease/phosphatase n=1 Tax=Mycolicibacterium vaccae ATCC 25954 TaxID=1194972 RepID=K0UX13_MYCVA|nr:endonuclease/exonuclease/phosphatase family protein [Mycolicibacterium vaccae]EJZ11326.1 endonuclease/exonuclease/phosphatase [Mycolicibacterium vaccae ATCC 25954]MCV7061579.1 endonuclease/exonuclease/phosphatase family protein [Mycolicibacterium vaccae]